MKIVKLFVWYRPDNDAFNKCKGTKALYLMNSVIHINPKNVREHIRSDIEQRQFEDR